MRERYIEVPSLRPYASGETDLILLREGLRPTAVERYKAREQGRDRVNLTNISGKRSIGRANRMGRITGRMPHQ